VGKPVLDISSLNRENEVWDLLFTLFFGDESMKKNQLARSQSDRIFLGVAGGLSSYLDIDPVIIRLAFVLTTLYAGGIGLLVYLVSAMLMPEEYIATDY
jgi:phage shock protein C